ncbi:methionyl-tRNA formyltransferase [Pustulibacterium marinum]|uniref:Methionyl-tRNA formyltransferase n=1 Tax=Pustulibacterium marinum TaxID=1224947 RepID=A0A1I7HZK6_9FLAO|nr:methionyl-tRNA formyltransferase [Pustulibacterium marinum]SFU66162.1 methionyl-tRNA formyltransferase [Pustulibacterium marinum]
MKDLRIVFMGTPDFAVATLDALVKHNYNVVGVITAPDKPAGRGRKLQHSAVKEYALSKNLHILQPTNLKDETFLSELKSLNANLQIVVAFRMLPKVVWQMPELGTFNLHASLLPNYRGAAPINWAIINGEEKTGVTTFFIDEKIDTGAMIQQSEVIIDEKDSAGTLHDKLMTVGANLVIDTVQQIEKESVVTTIQDDSIITKDAFKIHKDTCLINWEDSVENIYNFVRGMSPYPTAWTVLEQDNESLNVKIYTVSKEKTDVTEKPGTLIASKKEVKVSALDGYIFLKEIQLPGKKRMDIKSVLNGFSFSENAIMRKPL